MDFPPLDFSRLVTSSVADRRHLVEAGMFARPVDPAPGAPDVLDTLPDVLAARTLRRLAERIVAARREGHIVVLGYGGHVVKTGLAPLLVDLMERGYVHALATNGSGALHDFELAAVGHSSEDVGPGLSDGSWGMVAETAAALNAAAARAAAEGRGLGEVLGRQILDAGLPHARHSLLAAAARLGLPVTVHVAIGTDTVHMHADADGAAIGAASLADFRTLAAVVARLSGGVYLNVGSAVVMPEVFVKALNVARNLGHAVDGFATANLDMLRHYRPKVNVLDRPGGEALELTGHHEINVPLLRWAILRKEAAGAAGTGAAGAQGTQGSKGARGATR
jgi:deoxyhypusine synthase